MTWAAAVGWLLAMAATGLWLSDRRRLARTRLYVARAEHELRGPMTAISLGIERALRPKETGPQTLGAVRAELDRVALALADLAAARLGRRGLSEHVPVDLMRVITDSVDAWRPVAAAAGVELELCCEGLRQPVMGDRVRIAQAVGNLIANAIEHGGGRVRVSAACDGHRGRIQVSDEGSGLSTQAIAGAGQSTRSNARGHGLAIAAGVAAAHGGTLRVAAASPRGGESAAPAGAALVLELPAVTLA